MIFPPRTARSGTGVLLRAVPFAVLLPFTPLAAQDVVSQVGTLDTAMFGKIQRENSAQFASPLVVFDPATKKATVELANRGSAPLTVDLHLDFYRVKADTGKNLVAPNDSGGAAAQSLARWVKGLPAKVTIAPGATQTVPLTLEVPADAKPGEYWARLSAHAPTLQRQIPAVVQALMAQPSGDPALVQQSTMANMTIEMTTSTKLVYRQGAASAAVAANGLTATWLPANGQVRVCATFSHTGSAAAMGTMRFAVTLPSGADTLRQSWPFELQDTQAACFNVNAFALPYGSYKVLLALDADRSDVSKGALLSFPATRLTADLTVPPGSSPKGAPEPPPARPRAPGGVPFVEVLPGAGKGTLNEQLTREAQQATKDGKVALVEIGASWCGPCQAFLQALSDTSMVSALKDARVIRVDFDRWGMSFLGNTRYTFPASLPMFFTLAPDGSQGALFDINGQWGPLAQQYGGLDARTMAPTLKAFVAEDQKRAKGGAASK